MDKVSQLFPPRERAEIARFGVGDTVRVHVKVVEANRERSQMFEGVVISRHKPEATDGTFTVRRIASHGVGVERIFMYQSPRVEKVEVVRLGKVRRAKLRDRKAPRGDDKRA